MIRKKNSLTRKLNSSADLSQPEVILVRQEIDNLKAQVKEKISVIKLHRRSKLRSKLLLKDPTRRRFWRFLKGQMKAAGKITALTNKAGQMVFEQEDIEEAVLAHFENIFEGKRVPIYPADPCEDQVQLALADIEQILGQTEAVFAPDHFEDQVCRPYSSVELDQILQNLPSGKASGYDRFLFISKMGINIVQFLAQTSQTGEAIKCNPSYVKEIPMHLLLRKVHR